MSLTRICGLCWILLLIGCTAKAPSFVVVERVETPIPAGGQVTFLFDQKGMVTTREGKGPELAWGRKFKIEGEVNAVAAVGDFVYIDLEFRVERDKWSTIANAIGKVESVQSGKARFKADFYITEIRDMDCRLKITHRSATKDQRDDWAEMDIRVRAPL